MPGAYGCVRPARWPELRCARFSVGRRTTGLSVATGAPTPSGRGLPMRLPRTSVLKYWRCGQTSRACSCHRRGSCRRWPMKGLSGQRIELQRVLRAHGQSNIAVAAGHRNHRPSHHAHCHRGKVWCWDMTLSACGREGHWFFLYLILDLYSRKIVGREVHDSDDRTMPPIWSNVRHWPRALQRWTKPVLHGDNGTTLKATTVLAMLNWLGVKPRTASTVRDDNAMPSLFRPPNTAGVPLRGFADLAQHALGRGFAYWYNHEHRHSGIRCVSPAQRHGEDRTILAARHQTYQQARLRKADGGHAKPATGRTIGAVTLNPERDALVIKAHCWNAYSRWSFAWSGDNYLGRAHEKNQIFRRLGSWMKMRQGRAGIRRFCNSSSNSTGDQPSGARIPQPRCVGACRTAVRESRQQVRQSAKLVRTLDSGGKFV